jgi:WD40 repeat protein
MLTNREYFAFISYQREDEEWAKWLAHELEHYHFPISLNGRNDLPKDLRPIFRDIDELSAGNLPNQIHKALTNSKHLIVICSPRSAKSKWVNKEIDEFINLGRTNRIFPFIIDGTAFSNNPNNECFPPALRGIPKEEERLGGNINEMGRDAAVVKIVAGMLDLDFDTLWQRYEREKAEEERKVREQRDNLLKVQSYYLAEKAVEMVSYGDSHMGRILSLMALPHDIDEPDRPFVIEAEKSLRYSSKNDNAVLHHNKPVIGASLNDEGNCLISLTADYKIHLWSIKTGMIISEHKGYAEFYPEYNSALLYTKKYKDIIIFDAFTNDKIFTFVDVDFLIAHVTLSPNKKILAVSWRTGGIQLFESEMKEYDLINRSEGVYLQGSDIYPTRICFSLDSNYLLAKENSNIYIWNINNRQSIYKIESVTAAAFCSDSTAVIVAKTDNSIQLIEIMTGKIINTYTGHKSVVNSLYCCKNNKCIISASEDGVVLLWDKTSGKVIRELKGHNDSVCSAFSSSNEELIVSASQDRDVRIWGYDYYHEDSTISGIIGLSSSFNPNGQSFVIGDLGGCLSFIDSKSRKLLKKIKAHNNEIQCLSYSHDGMMLVTASNYEIRVWDVENALMLMELDYNLRESINSVSFSPNNKEVAITSGNKILIWNLTKDIISTLRDPELAASHTDTVNSANYNFDGSKIVSASYDRKIKIWNAKSFELEKSIFEDGLNIMSAIFSPNGHFILSASGCNVSLWNSTTGEHICSYLGHTQDVSHISFSPNGLYVVSASEDYSIKIWDVQSCIVVESHNNQGLRYTSISFSPHNNQILLTSLNGIAKIIQFPSLQDLINENSKRYSPRVLSREERDKYHIDY